MLAQSILDQTVNCGEKSPKIAGPPLVKSWGTPMVTRDKPIYTVNCPDHSKHGEWEGHFWESPGYRGDIETNDIESSEPGLDSPVSDPGRRGGTARESFCVESGGLRDGVFFVWQVGPRRWQVPSD